MIRSQNLNNAFFSSANDGSLEEILETIGFQNQVATMDQTHSSEIAFADSNISYKCDGIYTNKIKLPLVVKTADCVPLLMESSKGVSATHAGWRGLLSGVIDNACSEMINLGGRPTRAEVGPCIRPGYYEFGVDDLKLLERQFGSEVRSRTKHGEPSLDIPKTVHVALTRNDVHDIFVMDQCTATSDKHWSYRVGKDEKRQAMIAWLEETV